MTFVKPLLHYLQVDLTGMYFVPVFLFIMTFA